MGSDHDITASPIKDGLRVVCLAPSGAAITGTSGSLFTVEVKADADMAADKDYVAEVTGVVLTTTFDRNIEMDDAAFIISIKRGIILDDVNNDGAVTPADAIMIFYHYFGVKQNGFNEAAANMNGDESISPADAIEVLYKYFTR